MLGCCFLWQLAYGNQKVHCQLIKKIGNSAVGLREWGQYVLVYHDFWFFTSDFKSILILRITQKMCLNIYLNFQN